MPRATTTKPKPAPAVPLRVRPLRRNDFGVIERLFGARGACGGCWCMAWRSEFGGKRWRASLGEPNRVAFERMVASGEVHGVLAFEGKEPVGWCSIGPRGDFPGLARSRVLQTAWSETTWSVTCFFIPTRHRGKGVATAMLEAAVELARARGATALEGYPQKPLASGAPLPGPFAWTGVPGLFERCGFERINPGDGRPIYVRKFAARGGVAARRGGTASKSKAKGARA
jgi:GNAT superfamily N-acetyltransferase